jgi:sugar phosphate permease
MFQWRKRLYPFFSHMAASWLSDSYDGGFWSYWIIPQGVGGNITPNRIQFITTQTGLRRKENSLTGCASPAIILTVTSAPMQQELLPR